MCTIKFFALLLLTLNLNGQCLGMQVTPLKEIAHKEIEYLKLLQEQATALRKQTSLTQAGELCALGHRLYVGLDLALAATEYHILRALETNSYAACLDGAQALIDVLKCVAHCNLADYLSSETKNSMLLLTQKTLGLYQRAHQGWIAAPPGTITPHNILALCSNEQEAAIKVYLGHILGSRTSELIDLSTLFITMRQYESSILS